MFRKKTMMEVIKDKLAQSETLTMTVDITTALIKSPFRLAAAAYQSSTFHLLVMMAAGLADTVLVRPVRGLMKFFSKKDIDSAADTIAQPDTNNTVFKPIVKSGTLTKDFSTAPTKTNEESLIVVKKDSSPRL
jgi:hypothetical protein